MIRSFALLETPRSAPRFEHKCEFERIRCPADAGHARAGGPIGGKFTALFSSSRLADFNWGWLSDILISERALRILEKSKITGFEVRPASVAFSRPGMGSPPSLFELIVTGWGGAAARASDPRTIEFCPSCRHRVYEVGHPRRIIDPAQWDGSDLFIVWPLPNFRFCTPRLVRILQQNRVSGVDVIPASEIPLRPGATLAPGPLTGCMPRVRAFEIAKHFDVL
jgi:hypothetical protein